MDIIKIGGVPEHFNLPWHLGIEAGEFEERNVDLQWTVCKGGTGQMTKALRDGTLDVCVVLTEGIIADIYRGNPSQIISGYINTPLQWGIHTGAENPLNNGQHIYDKRYAVSRLGSGSHLMAIVDAHQKGQRLVEDQFTTIKNLDGALESLTAQETDVFFWEKYTTKPYVDDGILRRLATYVTPWPCFMIAAREEILKEKPEAIIRMLRVIHDMADRFMLQDEESIRLVHKRYHQKIQDVERWFHATEWAIHGWVSNKMLKNVVYHLKLAGIITEDMEEKTLIWKR